MWKPAGFLLEMLVRPDTAVRMFFFLMINNSQVYTQMNQLTTLLSSMFSLVIVIPSFVQSVDPNMNLMGSLEIRNNYELLV